METHIIHIIFFQLIFWLFYEVFLRSETFFNANRWYLLLSSLVSLIFPFIKLPFFNKQLPQLKDTLVNQLPIVFIEGANIDSISNNEVVIKPVKLWYDDLFTLENCWLIGVVVFSFLLIYKLIRIFYLYLTRYEFSRK